MTFIFAQIYGIFLFMFGLATLCNPKRMKTIYTKLFSEEVLLYLAGILALFYGSIILTLHWNWTLGLPIVITFIGVWSIIKGFGLLVSGSFINLFQWIASLPVYAFRLMGAMTLCIGIAFVYFACQLV